MQQSLAEIEKQWAAIEPMHPIELTFLDKTFEKQYARQKMFGTTIFYATTLAIFIFYSGFIWIGFLYGRAENQRDWGTESIGCFSC